MAEWFFVTNHGLILATIAKHLDMTTREIGDAVGITERATHKIISDLEAAGYITKLKVGRRNKYQIHPEVPLKTKVSGAAVRGLLIMLGWKPKKNQNQGKG